MAVDVPDFAACSCERADRGLAELGEKLLLWDLVKAGIFDELDELLLVPGVVERVCCPRDRSSGLENCAMEGRGILAFQVAWICVMV